MIFDPGFKAKKNIFNINHITENLIDKIMFLSIERFQTKWKIR